jgi:hypothetical protein
MSRKITEAAIKAFNAGYTFSRDNTKVRVVDDRVSLYLFGHCIAYRQNCQLFISTCGWKTSTTKERLNGLSGVSISQKNGAWYLNGRNWDGSEVSVAEWEPLT